MAATCPTVAKANVQVVIVELEDVSGILQKPTAAGFIAPAGQATLSQTPEQSDSEELAETLDVVDQFQNSVGPGEASVPMYFRLPKDGGRMQGHALALALMGKFQDGGATTCKLSEDVTSADTEVIISGATGGTLPRRGVIGVGAEKIRYMGVMQDATGTILTSCVRGYAGTTAESHPADAVATVLSAAYLQDICRPTVSVYVQFDHTVMFGSGGVVTNCEIPMSNEGGQKGTFSLQFRRMGWAGRSFVAGLPLAGVVKVNTIEGKPASHGYTIDAYVKNTTRKDSNNDAGYRITGVNHDAGTITVSPPPVGWADGDQIDPWLPEVEPIGVAIESRDTRVFIDGASGKITEGSIALGTPTSFTREIGDEFPGESGDGKRQLTFDAGMYFRAKDVTEIGKGYGGYEVPVHVVLGNKSGASLSLAMPRVKLATPTVTTSDTFLTLSRTGAVMGVKGEDSLQIIQE